MTDPEKTRSSKKKSKKSRKRRPDVGLHSEARSHSRTDRSHAVASAGAAHASSDDGAPSGGTNLPLLIAAGGIAIFALTLPSLDGGHSFAHGSAETGDPHEQQPGKVELVKGQEAENLARLAEELDELPPDPEAEEDEAPELSAAPPPEARPAVVELQPPKLEPPALKPPRVDPPRVDPARVDPPKVDPPSLTPPKPAPPKASPAPPPPAEAPQVKEAAPPKQAAPPKPAPAPPPPKPILPGSNPY